MRPVPSFVELEFGPTGQHNFAEINKGFDELTQGHHFRATVVKRQHIGPKGRL